MDDQTRSGVGADDCVPTIIGIGNDHAGYELKMDLLAHLQSRGYRVVDYGHGAAATADYPVYGRLVAEGVARGDVTAGIVICGSGVGISITANKVPGIRAVCCAEPYSALLSRQHNDTNVLAIGARVVGSGLARLIVDSWLSGEFEGGRHAERLALINDLEGLRDGPSREGSR